MKLFGGDLSQGHTQSFLTFLYNVKILLLVNRSYVAQEVTATNGIPVKWIL